MGISTLLRPPHPEWIDAVRAVIPDEPPGPASGWPDDRLSDDPGSVCFTRFEKNTDSGSRDGSAGMTAVTIPAWDRL